MSNELQQLMSSKLDILTTGFTPRAISTAATVSILTSTKGILHTVVVGMLSCPTLTIYDNASGASGTILALIEPGAKNTYVYDVTVVNGITASLQSGSAPLVHVTTRP